MELGQSMSMRMGQHQVLTPRMIQSMEILQLPVMALEERIDQEMATNPVLEMRQTADEPRERANGDVAPERAGERIEIDPNSADAAEFQRLERIAEYLENEEFSPSYRGRMPGNGDGDGRDGKLDAMANTAARAGSLAEHLLDQWRLTDRPADLDRAGRYVIEHLDADGYLRASADQLVREAPFPLTREQLERAVRLVQQLDPPGVGARDLRECLLLQLEAMEQDEEMAEGHDFDLERALVADHLDDLKNNRYPQIAKRLNTTIDALKAAVRRLARLAPHPGRAFGPSDAPPITPDATITKDEQTGRYEIRMRRDAGDDLYVRKRYKQMLADKNLDKRTREFLSDKVRGARWRMEAIQQRKNTLARVIRVVVDAQREFFEKGPEFLKPLPMIGVADQLGIHVATVSRAVSEKWVQTPVGLFPLRRFFSMGTTDAAGNEMSWDAVKERIRRIIDDEDKREPLDDEAIAAKVKADHGIDLARRTVAKYRKLLNIPTARQRREF